MCELDYCPACNSCLIGMPIPPEDQYMFGGAKYFLRTRGIEHPELYDGILEWECPDCGHRWPSETALALKRFSGKYL